MEIQGKPLANAILMSLKRKIGDEKLNPQIAIIYVGSNANSLSYITSKMKAARKIGVYAEKYIFSENQHQECKECIEELNNNPDIHGIIIQLPLPAKWNRDEYIYSIADEKDVDGFKISSPFFGATALGIWEMLGEFARKEGYKSTEDFLQDKNIVIAGKGITAGKPIQKLLSQKGFAVNVIDSQTPHPNEILKQADIIISATGKKHLIHKDNIKEGVYLIGVGVGREVVNNEEKVYGDLHPNIKEKARMYAPTLGGIGPLTIACLLRNVVEASQK